MLKPPRTATMLGTAGFLPALAACTVAIAGPVDWHLQAADVCAAYAAVVLSFLGGTWWGLASREGAPLAGVLSMSVLPSLAAWSALLLARPAGLVLLGLLFLAVLPGDCWLANHGRAPDWWMSLRAPLSVGMAALTLVTAAAVMN